MATCSNCHQPISAPTIYLALVGGSTRCRLCGAQSIIRPTLPGGKWGAVTFFALCAAALFAVLWSIHPILALVVAMVAILGSMAYGDLRTYRGLEKLGTLSSRKAAKWFVVFLIAVGIFHLVKALFQYHAG